MQHIHNTVAEALQGLDIELKWCEELFSKLFALRPQYVKDDITIILTIFMDNSYSVPARIGATRCAAYSMDIVYARHWAVEV
eukprot:XP_001705984.1 Hypothetical protein GL50803_35981 [Giardia lamblia ATCC 50803]